MRYEPAIPRRAAVRCGALLLVVVLSIVFSAPAAFAQMGTGRMKGVVRDLAGNPIAGVEVVATNPEVVPSRLEDVTDDTGTWVILGLATGNWTFTFTAQGFITQEVRATVRGNRNDDLDRVMNPLTEEAGLSGMAAGAEGIELFNEGNTMFDAGDHAGAVAKWNEFLLLNPSLHLVHGNLGNAYREMGDIENARAAYERLLLVEPDNTMANYNLGEMLIESGEIESAMPYFEKVVEGAPDDPAVYYNVAELYFSQRQMEPAITYYKRAIETDPSYLSAHMQLGFAYVNAGDIPNAILSFEKYVELAPPDDPQLAVVRDVLAALKSG